MNSPCRDDSNAPSFAISGSTLATLLKFDLAKILVFSAELQSFSRKSKIFYFLRSSWSFLAQFFSGTASVANGAPEKIWTSVGF